MLRLQARMPSFSEGFATAKYLAKTLLRPHRHCTSALWQKLDIELFADPWRRDRLDYVHLYVLRLSTVSLAILTYAQEHTTLSK